MLLEDKQGIISRAQGSLAFSGFPKPEWRVGLFDFPDSAGDAIPDGAGDAVTHSRMTCCEEIASAGMMLRNDKILSKCTGTRRKRFSRLGINYLC